MKQAHVLALLLVLLTLGTEMLVVSSQATVSKIPNTPNLARSAGQLPQGSAATNVHDQGAFQDHVSVIVYHKSGSASSPFQQTNEVFPAEAQ